MKKLLIGIIIGLIVGGLIGYFLSGLIIKPGTESIRNQNSQVDEKAKIAVTSFFNSNPTNEEVANYCQENRINCRYYCMKVNQSNGACKEYQPPQNMKR